jgi:hypothetical protein
MKHAAEFFAFARERHATYLRRAAGLPAPWSKDPILQRYKFTNVFRELDRTTLWFAKYVREPLRDTPEVLLATVVFRWFNLIRSGETLFCQLGMEGVGAITDLSQPASLLSSNNVMALNGMGGTAFDRFLCSGDRKYIEEPLREQGAPWITGAYMILSPSGMDKLAGLAKLCEDFYKQGHPFPNAPVLITNWKDVSRYMLANRGKVTLEEAWNWLIEFWGMGPFIAYEVITDLRHTALLDKAPDIMTWANPGPGALRGANRVLGNGDDLIERNGKLKPASYADTYDVMRDLLDLSRDSTYWPQPGGAVDVGAPGQWPAWEMREVEHTLCEFDKYERTRRGQGTPRGRFNGG